MARSYQIKIDVTTTQLAQLIAFTEDEQEYWANLSKEDAEQWAKLRDALAYNLDMIEDYPFDKNINKV